MKRVALWLIAITCLGRVWAAETPTPSNVVPSAYSVAHAKISYVYALLAAGVSSSGITSLVCRADSGPLFYLGSSLCENDIISGGSIGLGWRSGDLAWCFVRVIGSPHSCYSSLISGYVVSVSIVL